VFVTNRTPSVRPYDVLHQILVLYRGLLRRPSFFFAVRGDPDAGIGANSSIFSVIDAVLLRPLPYPGGDRLMALFESNPNRSSSAARAGAPGGVEQAEPTALWGSGRVYGEFARIHRASCRSGSCAPAFRRDSSACSAHLSCLGRGFNTDEEIAGGPQAAVISERIWAAVSSATLKVVGRALRFNGRSFPIVGVVPSTVTFPTSDVGRMVPVAVRRPGVASARRAIL